jgi:hypothetical protein
MDRFGQVLAKWHLSEQGYIVSFDLSCQSPEAESGPIYHFDVAGVRLKNGKAVHAIVGAMRNWWSPSAYLTPSLIRSHLLPGIAEVLSDDAVAVFRQAYDLGAIPIEKILFYSQASPEKASEAEEILLQAGIRTIYIERIAASLVKLPAYKAVHSDPLVMQMLGMMRGAVREAAVEEGEEQKEKLEKEPAREDPQLPLDLFGRPKEGEAK